MVVGRLLSYWEGNFSGAMLNFLGVNLKFLEMLKGFHSEKNILWGDQPPGTGRYNLPKSMVNNKNQQLKHIPIGVYNFYLGKSWRIVNAKSVLLKSKSGERINKNTKKNMEQWNTFRPEVHEKDMDNVMRISVQTRWVMISYHPNPYQFCPLSSSCSDCFFLSSSRNASWSHLAQILLDGMT